MPRSLQPDRRLFGTTLALCLIGAVMVFSASAITSRDEHGSAYFFLLRQLLWLALGIGGMFALMHFDYRKLRQPKVIFTAMSVTLVMLIAVYFLDRSHQTHRWIRLGSLSLQPSEIAKLALIVFLAWFLEIRTAPQGFGVNNWRRTLLPALGTALLIVVLVYKEPDMGTACMIFFIAAVMLFVAGLSFRYIGIAAVAALPIVYFAVAGSAYRLERVKTFFSPGADPQGHGFQLLQSLIAIGSGGFSGVGLMESRQKLFFLPEAHTDFIFSVVAEELGYIGAVIVIGLFAVYGWRALVAAMKAPDGFGRYLGVGIATMVVGQALINLSVVLGLVPTKGIPLPFVSYGGSNLLGMLLATGVLLNISQHADET
jgi:cell division protein FtsW